MLTENLPETPTKESQHLHIFYKTNLFYVLKKIIVFFAKLSIRNIFFNKSSQFMLNF